MIVHLPPQSWSEFIALSTLTFVGSFCALAIRDSLHALCQRLPLGMCEACRKPVFRDNQAVLEDHGRRMVYHATCYYPGKFPIR